jgi:hypothetical protein
VINEQHIIIHGLHINDHRHNNILHKTIKKLAKFRMIWGWAWELCVVIAVVRKIDNFLLMPQLIHRVEKP